MKASSALIFALLLPALPAFADVSVSTPQPNTTVGTPFVLAATASPCSGQAISSLGWSLDSGATTTYSGVTSLNLQVPATVGSHVVHVKSWGRSGASCTANVPITISATAAVPLYTDITVSQPTGFNSLVSGFVATASGTQCKSQPIVAFGWSIDNASNTTSIAGSALISPITAPLGQHLLHVKAWGNAGSACTTDIAINVVPDPATVLPSTVIAVNNIEGLSNWKGEFDTGTGAGTAVGNTALTTTPSLNGTARDFLTTTTNNAGLRYHVSFGSDRNVLNFLYDGWIYLGPGSENIANLELDMNQVIPNGNTVIYGFQCDSWSKTWDYAGYHTWQHSNQPCNLQTWAKNTWHHVQIAYSRDLSGNVTYQAVWLDNVEYDINATAPSSFALGWSGTLITNFQVDGNTSYASDSTFYLDNLTVYRW